MFKKKSLTQATKTIKQLSNNVHLATSVGSICAFWIEGVPQLILGISHMLIHLFYIHAQHRMIKAARRGRDKNGVQQCAVVSQLGHSLCVVMTSSRGSSNQPISFLKLHRDMALHVAEVHCATGGGGLSCACYTGAVHPQKGL